MNEIDLREHIIRELEEEEEEVLKEKSNSFNINNTQKFMDNLGISIH